MSCNQSIPCVPSYTTNVPYTANCGVDPCKVIKTTTDLTFYNGPALPCTGIRTCDSVSVALQKIDEVICQLKEQIDNCCTTTTTTTTAAPCACNSYEFAGSVFSFTTFTFVKCGESSTTTISVQDVPETYCVDNSYPIIQIGDGYYAKLDCCTTTTTTTTSAPTCNCYTATNNNAPGGAAYEIDYTDCEGIDEAATIDANNSFSFCALSGSIIFTGNVTLVDNGTCSGICP